MARKARSTVLYDHCFAHVFSRALDQKLIFQSHDDFEFFKALLERTKNKYQYQIHHYCLMNTHFHLAVSITKLKAFSDALKEIKQAYAKWVHEKNRKYKGPIWWGRFGSQVIENERYLYACGLYIEMNPVKAGMVKRAEEWPYSSSRHYFLNQQDPLIDSYEKSSYEPALELSEKTNFTRGTVIGSELFRLQIQESVYVT